MTDSRKFPENTEKFECAFRNDFTQFFVVCSVRHNEKEVEISRQNFVQYHDLAAFFLSGQWCYGTAASIFLCLARPLPLPLQPPALHTYKLKMFCD